MAGRKRKLNPRLAERILELIADGLTIRQVFEKEEIDYTWASFRKELVSSNELMDRYQKAKELAIDLELSNLKDKRLELEAKIESGEIDGKAGQNLVNLYKIIVASSQWSASKISSKKYGKAAEITLKGDDKAPINISWQS
ncbi:putative recombinase [uncultured Mediterranean phage uvMED]|jgi:hypothetical protein|nr:putative recombinase [uncultured Mediterranean phage uvMED]|tara:strand:- start:115 stop:537 length:423 start_codon:yes stop_codon:yes gene_type:complete